MKIFKEKSSPLKVVAWPHFLTGELLGVGICSHRVRGLWLYAVNSRSGRSYFAIKLWIESMILKCTLKAHFFLRVKLSQYGGYRTKLWNKRAIFTENTKFLQEIFVIKICGHKTINNTLDRLHADCSSFFLFL